MADMPRPLPPFLHREITRHKRPVWYFRRGKGQRIRIPGEFGSVEFNAAYDAALNGAPPARLGRADGTFAWALRLYRQSQAWGALSPATKRQRDNIFKHIEKAAGHTKLKDWKRGDVAAGRDKRAATPAAAGMFVKALRGFFTWALEAGLVSSNPTEGVKVVVVVTEGFAPWTEDDVAAYRAHWPLGTHQRVAFEMLRETGLRRGDAVRVGPPHVRDGVMRLTTEKTGQHVSIAVSDALVEAIKAGPIGDMTFIIGAGGDLSSKRRSRTCSADGRWLLGSTSRQTACGRQRRPPTPWTATAMPSFPRSSAGPAGKWRLCTRAQRIGNGCRLRPRGGRKRERKFPHRNQKVRA